MHFNGLDNANEQCQSPPPPPPPPHHHHYHHHHHRHHHHHHHHRHLCHRCRHFYHHDDYDDDDDYADYDNKFSERLIFAAFRYNLFWILYVRVNPSYIGQTWDAEAT